MRSDRQTDRLITILRTRDNKIAYITFQRQSETALCVRTASQKINKAYSLFNKILMNSVTF